MQSRTANEPMLQCRLERVVVHPFERIDDGFGSSDPGSKGTVKERLACGAASRYPVVDVVPCVLMNRVRTDISYLRYP